MVNDQWAIVISKSRYPLTIDDCPLIIDHGFLSDVSLLFYSIQWSVASLPGGIKNPLWICFGWKDQRKSLAFGTSSKSKPWLPPSFDFHLSCLLWTSTLFDWFGDDETGRTFFLGLHCTKYCGVHLLLSLFFLRNTLSVRRMAPIT